MFQIVNEHRQVVATIASEELAIAFAKEHGRSDMWILDPSVPLHGWVVDTLFVDSEPGTSAIFGDFGAAALFAAEPRAQKIVSSVRELTLDSLSAARACPCGEKDFVERPASMRFF